MNITEPMREAYASEVKRQARLLRSALRIRFVRAPGEAYACGRDMLDAAGRRDRNGWAKLYTNTEHNETPAVLEPAANLEGREYHDCLHVMLGADFTPREEARVAAFQRRLAPSGIIRTLVALDLHGSNEHMRRYGRFQTNAREWTDELAARLTEREARTLHDATSWNDLECRAALRDAAARLDRPG